MKGKLITSAFCLLSVVVLFTFFAALTQHAAQHRYLDYDSAYHASVSKNIANGYGYATSYDRRQILNPDITTGSTTIVPFASYLRFNEHQIQSPLAFAATFNLLLLAALLLVLGYIIKSPKSVLLFSLSLLWFLLMWEPKWFTAFTADMPVILLLCLVAGLLTLRGRGYLRATGFFMGVFIALAIKAKMTALIGLAIIVPALLFQLWFEHSLRQFVIVLTVLAGGFFVAYLPLATIENRAFAELTPDQQQAYKAQKKRFVMEHDSTGIKPLLDADNKIRHFVKSTKISYQVIAANMKRYGWSPYLIPVFFVLVGVVFFMELAGLLKTGVSPPLVFSGISLAFAAWYFLLCFSYAPKYPYTPIVFGMIALLLYLAKYRAGLVAIGALGLLSISLSAEVRQSHKQDYHAGNPLQQQYNADLESLVSYLDRNAFEEVLAGCGWHIAPRSVEYLMPGSGHFRDCFRVIGENLEPLPGQKGKYRWSGEPGFYAVIDLPLALYNKQDMPLRKPLERICNEQPVFRNNNFIVLHCPAALIKAELRLNQKQAGRFYAYTRGEKPEI